MTHVINIYPSTPHRHLWSLSTHAFGGDGWMCGIKGCDVVWRDGEDEPAVNNSLDPFSQG